MSGILSYIRTVGSKAEQERFEQLIDRIEVGSISISEILSLLNGAVWSRLPKHLRLRLLSLLQQIRSNLFNELEKIESNYVDISKRLTDNKKYQEVRNNYNQLTSELYHSSIFFTDSEPSLTFVERVNLVNKESYELISGDSQHSIYSNKQEELLFHQHGDDLKSQDAIVAYEKAFDSINKLDGNKQHQALDSFEKGAIHASSGSVPEFDTVEKCAEYLKNYGIVLAPYNKLKPIPKGVQREHLIPHSCFFGEYRKSGQSRSSVAIANCFGDYTEANALCIYVDDAQKSGTEHKMLTDGDRNFAKTLKNAEGEERFATLNEWLDHKELLLTKMLEANDMKRPPDAAGDNGMDNLSGPEKSKKAKLAAKAIIQGARLHYQSLGADLNAKMSNRIARGSIADENLIKNT